MLGFAKTFLPTIASISLKAQVEPLQGNASLSWNAQDRKLEILRCV